jgi:hypothetical protein
MMTQQGFLIFHYKTEDNAHSVMEKGSWMFGGKTIILQLWHPQFVLDKNKISKVPTWVRI